MISRIPGCVSRSHRDTPSSNRQLHPRSPRTAGAQTRTRRCHIYTDVETTSEHVGQFPASTLPFTNPAAACKGWHDDAFKNCATSKLKHKHKPSVIVAPPADVNTALNNRRRYSAPLTAFRSPATMPKSEYSPTLMLNILQLLQTCAPHLERVRQEAWN